MEFLYHWRVWKKLTAAGCVTPRTRANTLEAEHSSMEWAWSWCPLSSTNVTSAWRGSFNIRCQSSPNVDVSISIHGAKPATAAWNFCLIPAYITNLIDPIFSKYPSFKWVFLVQFSLRIYWPLLAITALHKAQQLFNAWLQGCSRRTYDSYALNSQHYY